MDALLKRIPENYIYRFGSAVPVDNTVATANNRLSCMFRLEEGYSFDSESYPAMD